MGVLRGSKWADNTNIMRENGRDSGRTNTSGGQGGTDRLETTAEVRSKDRAAQLSRNWKIQAHQIDVELEKRGEGGRKGSK